MRHIVEFWRHTNVSLHPRVTGLKHCPTLMYAPTPHRQISKLIADLLCRSQVGNNFFLKITAEALVLKFTIHVKLVM
jgi:hypothetical protein